MRLAEGFYSKRKEYKNLSKRTEEAVSDVNKSQRELDSLLRKMEAEDFAENLEEGEVLSLSKAMEGVDMPFHHVRVLSLTEMQGAIKEDEDFPELF